MGNRQIVFYKDLGLARYAPVWSLQENLLTSTSQVKKEQAEWPAAERSTKHYLLLVEHFPVYTLGKSGQVQNLLVNEEMLAKAGIDFFKINRGGDITFHGLQQIVGYPILDLEKMRTDIGWYLRSLEEVMIKLLAHYGLKGERSKGETGVWIEPDKPGRERKICALGVRCSRWITMHGWAININTDLDYFQRIVPCGIQNKQVTSLQKELGQTLDYEAVKLVLLQKFAEVFEVDISPMQEPLPW